MGCDVMRLGAGHLSSLRRVSFTETLVVCYRPVCGYNISRTFEWNSKTAKKKKKRLYHSTTNAPTRKQISTYIRALDPVFKSPLPTRSIPIDPTKPTTAPSPPGSASRSARPPRAPSRRTRTRAGTGPGTAAAASFRACCASRA